jgi:hypothetical protein
MIAKTSNNNSCVICGIPFDAEYFDVSGSIGIALDASGTDPFAQFRDPFKPVENLPLRGEQVVLASFQLHPQYCGVLTHFAQFTDLYARDDSQIETPGFEWLILQNDKPLFPYTRLERIINPWGCNCLPVAVRLDENARVEFVLRNRSISNLVDYPIKSFVGRILGRYWYNEIFGGRDVR